MRSKHLFFVLTVICTLLLPSSVRAQQDEPQVVNIPDPNLAAAIRQEIGDAITADTILNLTRLVARNRGITDLTGLQHARNLQHLDLGGEWIDGEGIANSNTISDFSPIAGLTRLTRLNLSFCGISDVSFVSGLIKLTWLDLGNIVKSKNMFTLRTLRRGWVTLEETPKQNPLRTTVCAK